MGAMFRAQTTKVPTDHSEDALQMRYSGAVHAPVLCFVCKLEDIDITFPQMLCEFGRVVVSYMRHVMEAAIKE